MGYETIDNIPLALLPRLIAGPAGGRPMALGIDVRTRDFSVSGVLDAYDAFKQDDVMEPSLLFVDCQTDALLRRYSETRRRHPLAPDETPLYGIELEGALLKELRSRADVLIDTTALTPHELKAEIGNLFSAPGVAGLAISVQSFSYKRGVPRGIDMVMDCRFLRNPYWDQSLRTKTGQDSAVLQYVSADPKYRAFFEQLTDMARLLLPAYRDEGKAHFSIGLGCTGGQHRSVAVAEELAKALEGEGWQVSKRHREMERRRGA